MQMRDQTKPLREGEGMGEQERQIEGVRGTGREKKESSIQYERINYLLIMIVCLYKYYPERIYVMGIKYRYIGIK